MKLGVYLMFSANRSDNVQLFGAEDETPTDDKEEINLFLLYLTRRVVIKLIYFIFLPSV